MRLGFMFTSERREAEYLYRKKMWSNSSESTGKQPPKISKNMYLVYLSSIQQIFTEGLDVMSALASHIYLHFNLTLHAKIVWILTLGQTDLYISVIIHCLLSESTFSYVYQIKYSWIRLILAFQFLSISDSVIPQT